MLTLNSSWLEYEVAWGEEEVLYKRLPTIPHEHFIRDFTKLLISQTHQLAKVVPMLVRFR